MTFAEWLEGEDKTGAENWSRRLKSSQSYLVESAVAEAVIWDYISSRCDSVRLADVPGVGGADFEFSVAGNQFLVEVTNISIEAAADASAMPDQGLYRARASQSPEILLSATLSALSCSGGRSTTLTWNSWSPRATRILNR